MHTANTMNESIGKTVKLCGSGGIQPEVLIMDAKSAYGRIRFLVKPIAGAGDQWVEESRLQF